MSVARVWSGGEVPEEITLTGRTVEALMDDPALMDEMEAFREQGGTAALIAFLDAHGLPWRPGGSSAEEAFEHGVATGFADWELFGPTAGVDPEVARARRRKAARKAARKARRR